MVDDVIGLFSDAILEKDGQGALLIRSSLTRLLAWAALGLPLAGLGILLLKKKVYRWGCCALAVPVLVFLIVLPGLAREKIVITDEELKVGTGLWFAPTERSK